MILGLSRWEQVKDGNADAFELMRRHYSFRAYKDGRRERPNNPSRKLFVGPGEKMVLITEDRMALFVWRKFKNDSRPQGGVNCAVFRNEGSALSSRLIRAAEELAWQRWPHETLYTYVSPKKVRSSNPGFCFLSAGWQRVGATSKGLLILEKSPPHSERQSAGHTSDATANRNGHEDGVTDTRYRAAFVGPNTSSGDARSPGERQAVAAELAMLDRASLEAAILQTKGP